MPQVIVNDLLISYVRQGAGKPVLLLHGWGDNALGLKNIIDKLALYCDVIAVDLPGFGASETPTNQPWNLDDYAYFVQKFIKKVGITKCYAIIGHSNGGAIAIRGIALNAFKADKLILLASSGIRNNSQSKTTKKLVIGSGKKITKLLPKRYQQKIRNRYYKRSGSDILVVPELEQTFKMIVKQDIQTDLKNIDIPTLLLYGQNDVATPPEFGTILYNKIVGSKLVIIDGAGHFIHIDQPKKLLCEIESFLYNGNYKKNT